MTRTTFLLIASLAVGCADNIAHEAPDAAVPATSDAPPAQSGKVVTTRDNASGTYTTILDATSMTDWTYANFETGMEATPSGAWDLRFQRFHISTNGGAGGSGGVAVVPVTGTTFSAVTTAPSSGYISDVADGQADETPGYAFEQGDGWYDYDAATHVLTPKPTIWVVKTHSGATLKLEILRYYDTAGTSGWFTLHWGPL